MTHELEWVASTDAGRAVLPDIAPGLPCETSGLHMETNDYECSFAVVVTATGFANQDNAVYWATLANGKCVAQGFVHVPSPRAVEGAFVLAKRIAEGVVHFSVESMSLMSRLEGKELKVCSATANFVRMPAPADGEAN
jgi:hypothetical protein